MKRLSSFSNYQSLQQPLHCPWEHIVNLLFWQMIVKMRKWSRKVALILKSRGICQSLHVAKLKGKRKKKSTFHQLSACHSQISTRHGIFTVCVKIREWFRLHLSTKSNLDEALNTRKLFTWFHKISCVIFFFGQLVLFNCSLWSIWTNAGKRFYRKEKLYDLSESATYTASRCFSDPSHKWYAF